VVTGTGSTAASRNSTQAQVFDVGGCRDSFLRQFGDLRWMSRSLEVTGFRLVALWRRSVRRRGVRHSAARDLVGSPSRYAFCASIGAPRPVVRTKLRFGGMDEFAPPPRRSAPGKCPRCGSAVTVRHTGRPATWCSQRCRRAAYEERRAAASGAIGLQIVETVLVEDGHDLSGCTERVIASPAACRRVLHALSDLARAEELQYDAKWQGTMRAVAELADVLVNRRPGSRYLG